MIRIYTASKLHHAAMWRAIGLSRPGVMFTARWLKHMLLGQPEDPALAVEFWQEDITDVVAADAVLIYAEPQDQLRGALVEVGAALAVGVPVITAGESDFFGTWQYHPGVVARAPTVEDALVWATANIKTRHHTGVKP